MRYLLTSLLLVSKFVVAQEVIGVYRFVDVDSTGSFHTLTIASDSTYLFEFRGISCWIWHNTNGKWWVSNDQLILSDTFTMAEEYVIENHVVRSEEIQKEGPLVIQVYDRYHDPVAGIEMRYVDKEERMHGTYITDQHGIYSIQTLDSDLWDNGGKLAWDLPHIDGVFFSGEIEIQPHTDSIKVQYHESPIFPSDILSKKVARIFLLPDDRSVKEKDTSEQ
ncbi:MAG: hypothetical protein AAF399_07660 [Bacteroidota bacterium]